MSRQDIPFLLREKRREKLMPLAEEMKNIVDHIVSSYEARIQSIESLFDTTHHILRSFQNSFFDMKKERETINAELRENLAKNESLRKKDFDHMMEDILSAQEGREKEVRNLLNHYLNEQKQMAQDLRENLKEFKDSLSKGEVQRVKDFQEMIKQILAKQDERKEEVTFRLKKFKKEQVVLSSRLKDLLAKGNELQIRDFKSALKEYKGQMQERLVLQKERIKEIHHSQSRRIGRIEGREGRSDPRPENDENGIRPSGSNIIGRIK
jgi:molecular chaperone DnaK (HSP70)